MRDRSFDAPTIATPRGFRKRARSGVLDGVCTAMLMILKEEGWCGDASAFLVVRLGFAQRCARSEDCVGACEPRRGFAPFEMCVAKIQIAQRDAEREIADIGLRTRKAFG